MYAPLHTKSEHSAAYGTASVEELVALARSYGYSALALTDLENLYAHVKFHHAARAAGIRPITGVELRAGHGSHAPGSRPGRLVLLARDREGYESLCRIISRRRGSTDRLTPDPLNCLEADPRGVFFLTDEASTVRKLLAAGVPPRDIRFLLVRPAGAGEPSPAEVRAVADTDVVLGRPGDRDLHRLLRAIRERQPLSAVLGADTSGRVLPPPRRLESLFRDCPEAVAESVRIADACELDLTRVRPHLPSFDGLTAQAAHARLVELCRERLERMNRVGACQSEEHEQRLAHELAIVRALGFSAYFLIVAEIVAHAHRAGIALGGRGSAASSLVAHVLGVTPVDPLEHGLYFERFLHAGKRELPDIDIDVASNQRDALIDWVHARFGPERVAMISAHQTFGWRAAFREGLKAIGVPAARVDAFCAEIPSEEAEPVQVHRLPLHLLSSRQRASVPLAARLVGKPQHISVHPGGVVIADPRVDAHVPLERAPKGVLVTQFDMHSLAMLGLLKLDLLGNRALAAIQEAKTIVGQQALEVKDHDEPTLTLLRQARTVGCFQIETPALRSTLKQLPVSGIDDVMAALAIVRPGPASGAAKAAFIRRANGLEPALPPHSALSSCLRETFGLLLYEENVMAAIVALTGWTLDEADQARSALISGLADAAQEARLKTDFLDAAARRGIEPNDAQALWEILGRFASYSFNKAHAASYAHVAWQTAYLKAHHPEAFACGVLNHYGGDYPLRVVAADFARSGVRILAPHVNHSGMTSAVEPGGVRLGLDCVKHLTARHRVQLLENRPFNGLRQLLEAVPLHDREVESLVLGGCCDGLAPLFAQQYPAAHEAFLERWRQQPGPGACEGFVPPRLHGPLRETYRALVRARNELTYLGLHPSGHPMQVLRSEADREGCATIAALASRGGGPVLIAGTVAASRRIMTAAGEPLQFVTFEDETGLVETVIPPDLLRRHPRLVSTPGPYLVRGYTRDDQHLHVSRVLPFHLRREPYGSHVDESPIIGPTRIGESR